MQLVARSALLCDEDVRLQRAVPYLLTLLTDPSAAVRCAVIHCVVKLMVSIEVRFLLRFRHSLALLLLAGVSA